MTEQVTDWDAAEGLDSQEEIAAFIAAAFESGDAGFIAHTIGIVARSEGMTAISKKTGITREGLYRAFSMEGNPTLANMISVLGALGMGLTSNYVPVATAPVKKRVVKSKPKATSRPVAKPPKKKRPRKPAPQQAAA